MALDLQVHKRPGTFAFACKFASLHGCPHTRLATLDETQTHSLFAGHDFAMCFLKRRSNNATQAWGRSAMSGSCIEKLPFASFVISASATKSGCSLDTQAAGQGTCPLVPLGTGGRQVVRSRPPLTRQSHPLVGSPPPSPCPA